VSEQVAVVELVAAAERAGGLAELRVDEGVDDHRRAALRAAEREVEVVDGLDPRVADLLELLLRELRLERMHEPDGGLPGGVGDDVELDRRLGHAPERSLAQRRCCTSATVPSQTRAPFPGRLAPWQGGGSGPVVPRART
jgi:hypothetical protein